MSCVKLSPPRASKAVTLLSLAKHIPPHREVLYAWNVELVVGTVVPCGHQVHVQPESYKAKQGTLPLWILMRGDANGNIREDKNKCHGNF